METYYYTIDQSDEPPANQYFFDQSINKNSVAINAESASKNLGEEGVLIFKTEGNKKLL